MGERLELVEACEHGEFDAHMLRKDDCPGGSRRVLSEPTEEMVEPVEAAAEAILDRMGKHEHTLDEWNKAMAFARAALDGFFAAFGSTTEEET